MDNECCGLLGSLILTFHMWNEFQGMLLHCTCMLMNSTPAMEDLTSYMLTAHLQAELYKEDFMKERRDREKAAGKLDSLQRTQVEEIKCIQKELSQAKEDAQAKVSQVKQYKKQLDTQEAKACYVLIVHSVHVPYNF